MLRAVVSIGQLVQTIVNIGDEQKIKWCIESIETLDFFLVMIREIVQIRWHGKNLLFY